MDRKLTYEQRDMMCRRAMGWCLFVLFCVFLYCMYGCATIDRTGHHVATVTFQIHIVGDRSMYDLPEARNFNSGPAARNIGGYARYGNPPEIWLTGYRDEKGVRVDNIETLGHEVLEVLRMTDKNFANPHE